MPICDTCHEEIIVFRTDEKSLKEDGNGDVMGSRIYKCHRCGKEKTIPVSIPRHCAGALLQFASLWAPGD